MHVRAEDPHELPRGGERLRRHGAFVRFGDPDIRVRFPAFTGHAFDADAVPPARLLPEEQGEHAFPFKVDAWHGRRAELARVGIGPRAAQVGPAPEQPVLRLAADERLVAGSDDVVKHFFPPFRFGCLERSDGPLDVEAAAQVLLHAAPRAGAAGHVIKHRYRSRSAARQVPLQRFRFPPGELGDALQAREARYGYDPGIHAGTRVLKEREPDVAVEVEHLGGILADADTHVTRTADAFHFGRSALEAREGVTEERLPVDAERTADGHKIGRA